MGCMIKADENHRETTRKVSWQSDLLRSVLVHVASAFICAFVCSYSYWFPWFYCFINHFVWIYLPTVWPVVFGPKCMFIVANAIVVVVVCDWRRKFAKSISPCDDMYEEYVRRSRRPRRVLVYKKVERKEDATVKKKYVKALEMKKEEMVKEIVINKKSETAEEIYESKEDNIIETEVRIPEENSEVIEEAFTSTPEEKQEQISNDAKDDYATGHGHDDDVQNAKEAGSTDDGQNVGIKKAVETRSADDELNKRVEDFIARVNKRRWAEANNWLICTA